MNKSELINAIADKTDLTKADAGRALDAITSSITDSLKDSEAKNPAFKAGKALKTAVN